MEKKYKLKVEESKNLNCSKKKKKKKALITQMNTDKYLELFSVLTITACELTVKSE